MRNTFLKTLYVKRWTMFWWTLGVAALVVFTISFYPQVKTFGDTVQNTSKSSKLISVKTDSYRSITAYTDLQVISQMSTMLIILAVIMFTGLLAGEEGEGILQTLLVQPITRSRVYIEKLLAAMLVLAVAVGGVLLGIAIGLAIIHEHLNLGHVLEAGLATWLIGLVFGTFGYSLGAITGKRGIAGGIAGVLAFATVLVTTLSDSIDSLKTAEKLSPFHYFNKPGILQYGVHWHDLMVLGSMSIVFVVVGYLIFIRRDIYQR